jgi:hypothetical protein
LLCALVAASGCFGNETSQFPEGLEPLEDNTAPAQEAPYEERLEMVDGDNGNWMWVHGRGYLSLPPGEVWTTSKMQELMATVCSTDSQTFTPLDDEMYEHAFEVHYFVDEVINVEWDEHWRYGTIEGTPDAPELGMTRYQKVYGSELIRLIEGSIQVLATDDPEVTEIQYVEHLNAAGGGIGDMRVSMQHRFDAVAAAIRGEEVPACP